MYRYLMDKYNWDGNQIDRLDFYHTLELISEEYSKEVDEVVYIDELEWW